MEEELISYTLFPQTADKKVNIGGEAEYQEGSGTFGDPDGRNGSQALAGAHQNFKQLGKPNQTREGRNTVAVESEGEDQKTDSWKSESELRREPIGPSKRLRHVLQTKLELNCAAL